MLKPVNVSTKLKPSTMKQLHSTSFRILQLAIPFCLLASCGTYEPVVDPYNVSLDRQKENIYYVPSATNTPLSADKNMLNFNVTNSSGNTTSGVDVQASFLPTQHVGIIAGYSSSRNKGEDAIDYVNHKRFEIGAGYVTAVTKGWHFETYGGIGSGRILNSHHTGGSNIRNTVYFLQPALAFNNETRTVSIGLVSRFSGVNFSLRHQYIDPNREPFTDKQLASLADKPFHIMWEPGIILRGGWKNFKFHGGYTHSTDLTNSDLHRQSGNLSLGASLFFNTSQSKK
jgi:hypothetical protein